MDPTGEVAAGAIRRAPSAGGATDSLAPYVVGAVAAGALAGLGLKIRDALTYLGLVLSGAWTLVDIWQKVDNDDPNDCVKNYEQCMDRCLRLRKGTRGPCVAACAEVLAKCKGDL